MARRDQGMADALVELESVADRLGDWLQENFRIVAAAIIGLLVAAAIVAWLVSSHRSAEQDASVALAQTRADYLSAMGAPPGALDVPKLANPEAAAEIRAEYEKRFGEVASEHHGTVAGALAVLEQARLATESGHDDQAIALLEQGIADAPKNGPVHGMMLQRLAQRLESADRWADAAARDEQAAAIETYPLRYWALADAARCRARAGEGPAALALYERLEREAPKLGISEDQRAEMLELRAAAGRTPAAAPAH